MPIYHVAHANGLEVTTFEEQAEQFGDEGDSVRVMLADGDVHHFWGNDEIPVRARVGDHGVLYIKIGRNDFRAYGPAGWAYFEAARSPRGGGEETRRAVVI